MSELTCFAFTKKDLDTLPLPAPGSRGYYRDSKVRGLQMAVYPTGRKSFVLYRKIEGRPERILIGSYPDLSIEQARGKASELNGAIAREENPAESRRKLNAEATLQEAFTDFLERYKKPKRKSWQEDEGQMRRYLDWDKSSRWKLKKLSDIRRADIEHLHVRIGEDHGPYAANRLLALLKAIFNFAMRDGWKGPNPAEGIPKFAEQARERFLQADEMPRFFKALNHEETEPLFRDYFLACLLTGARRTNVLAMRWEEINFAMATWTIPDTKGGDPLTVAIVPEALKILKARRALVNGSSPWVFPTNGNGRKSASGHIEEPKGAWQKVLQRAGIKNLRLHDLRRTLGSWQAANGASLPLIGKSLGHKNQSTTAIYARLHLDPVRTSVKAAARAMLAAGKTGKVRRVQAS
jgi:integrase